MYVVRDINVFQVTVTVYFIASLLSDGSRPPVQLIVAERQNNDVFMCYVHGSIFQ